MRALTGRGQLLLGLGLVSAGAGWGLDQPAVVAVAVALILLPVLGLITVRRSRFVLGSARTVSPTRLPFGAEGEVLLTVENGSRLPSGSLLLEDRVPASLGTSVHLVLDRIPSRAQRAVHYPIEGRQRGRARVGPLTVVVTDPFGTASLTRAFEATTPVLVTPQVVPLGNGGGSLSAGGRGETMLRSIAARGNDDLLPREHRPGDDMRRIHWRATARHGDLMVRREEQSWHSTITVLLDDRAHAHEGAGAGSTFEWAVSAAASVAVHFQGLGWRVTVLSTTGRVLAETSLGGSGDLDALLEGFAEARLVDGPMALGLGLDTDASTAVVAVLGRITDDATSALARPVAGFAGCLLRDPGPVGFLQSHGWRVATWTRSTRVDDAWRELVPVATGAGVR